MLHFHWYMTKHFLLAVMLFLTFFVGSADAAEKKAKKVHPLDEPLASFLQKTGIKDYGVVLVKGDKILYLRNGGSINYSTPLRLGSAQKWITAASVMAYVDTGRLNLDSPVKTWLKEYPAPHGDLTIRQLLSYTSGLGSVPVEYKQKRWMTLRESSNLLTKIPLNGTPGKVFNFGGPDYQLAGAVAESVDIDKWPWYIAAFKIFLYPAGMSSTYWGNPSDRANNHELATNPILQGGMVSTMGDYVSFLSVMTSEGYQRRRQVQVFSPEIIKEMEKIHTKDVEMKFVPSYMPAGSQYALGHWCEEFGSNGECTLYSSPSERGFYPWIDKSKNIFGIIVVNDKIDRIIEAERELIQAMRAYVK